MARSLGRGHAYVDPRGGDDGLEVDVESVREHQQLTRRQVRPDVFGVDLGLNLVGSQDHHHVGPLRGLGRRNHIEARLLRLGNGLRFHGGQAHLHLHS